MKIEDMTIGMRVVSICSDGVYRFTTDGWEGKVTEINVDCFSAKNDGATFTGLNPIYFVPADEYQPVKCSRQNCCKISATESNNTSMENKIIKLVTEYGYKHSDHAIEKIVDTWSENKGDLISMFSKHPNWDEENYCIVLTENYGRQLDPTQAANFANWFFKNFNLYCSLADRPEWAKMEEIETNKRALFLFNFLDNISTYSSQYVSEKVEKILESFCSSLRIRTGMKMSRAMRKLFDAMKMNEIPDFEREFAKFADSLNPLNVIRYTIVSVNPLDYLTMSFGNSWTSCHTIDKLNIRNFLGDTHYSGCYSSGTISYMLDPSSFVVYTVDGDYNGNNYASQPKITRQMFHFGEDKLVQGRLYPQGYDGAGGEYAMYRNIVQKVIAECLDIPNLWTLHTGNNAAFRYIETHGTHYDDYYHYSDCNVSVTNTNNPYKIMIGHAPICIECGYTHDDEECINCCHLPTQNVICSCCGCVVNENNTVTLNEKQYCMDCVVKCEDCGNFVLTKDFNLEIFICNSCAEHYSVCDDCGNYVHESYYNNYDDKIICNYCRREHYADMHGRAFFP